MKKLILIIFLGFIFLMCSCDIKTNDIIDDENQEKESQKEEKTIKVIEEKKEDVKEKSEEEMPQKEYFDLYLDPYFKDGFKVYSPSESSVSMHSDKLVTLNETTEAKWEIAQWSSKYDIYYAKKASGFGEYSFTCDSVNPVAKKLIVNTNTGSLKMTLNASVEYDHDRKDGESWPHLLLSQSYFGTDLVHVSEMDEINMNVSYKISSCVNKTNNYNSNLHCAQLVWYITLQNRNENSKDFGSYVWFGLGLFDSRQAGTITSGYAALDGGKENNTGAFIYGPSSDKYITDKMIPNIGDEVSFSFNILSEAKAAFDLAKERGYLGSTTWEDIYIGGTNFGFEVTGTFDITATINYIAIKCLKKDN